MHQEQYLRVSYQTQQIYLQLLNSILFSSIYLNLLRLIDCEWKCADGNAAPAEEIKAVIGFNFFEQIFSTYLVVAIKKLIFSFCPCSRTPQTGACFADKQAKSTFTKE